MSTVKSQEYGVVMDTLGHTILYFKRYRYVLFTTALWGAGEGGRRGHEEDRGALTLAHGRQPRRVPLALRYVHELCASVSLSRASKCLPLSCKTSVSLSPWSPRTTASGHKKSQKREHTCHVSRHDNSERNKVSPSRWTSWSTIIGPHLPSCRFDGGTVISQDDFVNVAHRSM